MTPPTNASRQLRPLVVSLTFCLILAAIGLLRAGRLDETVAGSLAGLATPLYVAATVIAGILLIRSGAPFERFGFERSFQPGRHLALALAAILLMQAASLLLGPVWETLFGAGRDLDRFSGVSGDAGALVRLLVYSWAFAAFGEEIAFRIVLMGGLVFAFGGGRRACAAALVIQALVFGLVHLYQGPTGVAATTINGLIYGGVVLAARGSIWPAAIAHGGANTIGILRLYLSG